MLISKKWLGEFVDVPSDVSDADLAKTITLSTVEVEEVIDQAAALDSIVVGKIVEVGPHPNADKLQLCQVDVGGRVTQIVCGGSNVAAEMMVAVALPGARVRWHGEGDLIELKQTKIRGESSEGMICASSEIGLAQIEGDSEIRDLGDISVEPGTALAQALGLDDVVFDIEHKSLTNRPDLMGHYGMAREVAALTGSALKPYQVSEIASGSGVDVRVEVKDPQGCPRYMAVAMEGVVVGPSPDWVQNRLRACGIRAINNVVDVTNLVLLELGQPMHAFDVDVVGTSLVVRRAKQGEDIVALDEQTYALGTEDLVIANEKDVLAIAGVMGGQGSGVSDKTTRIVFECANFSPVDVRKTSTRLGLRSESSSRFEKSLDPRACEQALARAVALMRELSPSSEVRSMVVDQKVKMQEPVTHVIDPEIVRSKIGVEIGVGEMEEILNSLGFATQRDGESLKLRIPSWRATKDVEIKEDIIEEIARIWGYEKIESTMPSFSIVPPVVDPIRSLGHRLRDAFKATGANETYQYAFVSPETLEAFGFILDDHLKLANPLAADRPYLVRSLVPNLLETIVLNQRQVDVVSLFQVERVFLKDVDGPEAGDGEGVLPAQPVMAGFVYSAKGNDEPFWEAKRVLERVVAGVRLVASENPQSWQHATRQADVFIGDERVGVISEVDPRQAQAFGLDHRVAVIELNVDVLSSAMNDEVLYEPMSIHPVAERDLAMVVEERVAFEAIESAVQDVSELLRSVSLFDVYRGEGIDDGHKSLGMRLVFQASDRTLASEEVEAIMEKIRGVLATSFSATMRS